MDLLITNHRDLRHRKAGGAEQVIYEISRRLVKKGVSVTWLSEEIKGLPKEEEIENIRIIRRGNSITLHLYAPIEARRHEIVIDSVAHAVPFYSYLVNKNAIALVHHVHQDVVKYELNPIMARAVAFSERSVSNYKSIIAVSNTTKRDLVERLKAKEDRIEVIHNGIDHNIYRPGKKASEPTILWIGRLKKYKNPLDAIDVAKRVKAKLVMAGGGDLENEVVQKIKTINGEYLGRVSEEDKIRLYQSAWIVIVTSFIEGWSMVTVEANACGTPVIAYNKGSLPEIIKNGVNGYIVNYKDIEAMSKIINELIEDEKRIKELWKSSYEESLNYDWDKSSEKYYNYLIRKALD
ncbi:glycosyltransferase family 1 protein [Saccharolobus solfataricus]|uniref:Glycosyltransferase, putative n=3 Tax=Saccharolobus solfataricus TaxID=2287 RepID=Q97V61_SACS2|nr:glycosyltransferase family 4 protein [Saccharolobus solfataricus]AAK42884.1 Glycosyltransferase, putative [Saccharolobus solfataricus P2]AKA72977.1 glycosyltransferase family 1 protein [Saccharolobus solfataricus]AKA75676.1 glycosyltransferase family 1 protein [Saccharolobus solfataricus]AKA78369.1 glycosyltransferase family 1 protein [Saccharolobus solfataricus]AZF67488.1 glycosyltransferase family 1 protein [Saccharolobus solfataricus]